MQIDLEEKNKRFDEVRNVECNFLYIFKDGFGEKNIFLNPSNRIYSETKELFCFDAIWIFLKIETWCDVRIASFFFARSQ